MYRKLASALLVAGAIGSQNATAVSLGEITMNSALNEPLDAVIKLKNTEDFDASQILVKLANAEEYEQAGIERTFFLSDIKFSVEVDGEGNGYVHLSSERRVNEPFIDILLEGRWPTGRMLRSYTVLVDLPVYKEPQTLALEQTEAKPSKENVNNKPQQEKVTDIETSTDLAPASQPAASTASQRAASSQIDQALQGDEYFTQRNDTLWVIAKRHAAGTDLSVNQTMTAIQQENPHAFINNNINLLKQGVVLRLPAEEEIRSISEQQANQAVSQQNKQWREAQLDNKQPEPAPADADSIEESGHLRLSSAGVSSVAGEAEDGEVLAGLQAELSAVQDEAAASQSENQELSSRVKSLNAQIEQLERLIELKDAELASLQQELGQAAGVDLEAADKKENAEAKQDQQPDDVVDAKKAEESAAAELKEDDKQAPTEEKTKTEKTKQAADKQLKQESVLVKEKKADPKKQEKPAEPVESKASWFDLIQQNPIYIGLLGLLIAIGVGGFLLRRRTQDENQLMAENDSFNFGDETEGSVQEDESLEEESPVEEQQYSASEELITGDALEEADVYLQFGRYDQAIDILSNAIRVDASQSAVAAKLAEAYLEVDDQEACQQLYLSVKGQDEQLSLSAIEQQLQSSEKGCEWLEQLRALTASKTGKVTADIVAANIQEDEFLPVQEDEDRPIEYEEVSLEETEANVLDTNEILETDSISEEADDLDLDFDLSGDLELDSDIDLDVDSSLLEADEDLSLDVGDALADLELELDLNDETSNDESDELEVTLDFEDGNEDLDNSLLDVSLDTLELDAGDETEVEEDEAELSLDDFDLDFDELTTDDVELADVTLDDSSSLVLDTEEMELESPAEVSLTDFASSAELNDDEALFVESTDEVATKLDLAQAYMDMGDTEGAKEMLDEVLEEGTEAQKQEANDLLAQLG